MARHQLCIIIIIMHLFHFLNDKLVGSERINLIKS